MKLHYSQTIAVIVYEKLHVSVPYEITLLSNPFVTAKAIFRVSVPYEITLLSNGR